MTQEEKELLLKDLCGRLPYGAKIHLEDFPNATLIGVVNEGIILHCDKYDHTYDTPWNIEYVKPYLFPLSSMTKEQTEEVHNLIYQGVSESVNETSEWLKTRKENDLRPITLTYILSDRLVIDWFCKNHFDYRGLIERGLANDATGLNIY